MRRCLFLLSIVTVILMTGCFQRIKYEKTYNMEPLTVQPIGFSAPAYEQRVSVVITPTEGPVSSYLCLEVDEAAVDKALQADKEPPASLLKGSRVSKDRPESYTVEATIPAKSPYVLLLKAGPKKTSVHVNLTGK